ncbi:hypothetical protein [Streptomyces sp. NBC_00162]|uniref:hypothetical protein n=1 Tax=Streptomyces sp. NBC_00162 TaxID=2903629 RepID=UPI00214CD3D7|nr:hypothetical protein [Streptomyces sp. NBC_00162]UUU38190.1 hypothetical protein JIW86_04560 [Streptomyces sp. NBC_00162]
MGLFGCLAGAVQELVGIVLGLSAYAYGFGFHSGIVQSLPHGGAEASAGAARNPAAGGSGSPGVVTTRTNSSSASREANRLPASISLSPAFVSFGLTEALTMVA